jgi:ABC-type branched-subunit amino acid transport system permease subunit
MQTLPEDGLPKGEDCPSIGSMLYRGLGRIHFGTKSPKEQHNSAALLLSLMVELWTTIAAVVYFDMKGMPIARLRSPWVKFAAVVVFVVGYFVFRHWVFRNEPEGTRLGPEDDSSERCRRLEITLAVFALVLTFAVFVAILANRPMT